MAVLLLAVEPLGNEVNMEEVGQGWVGISVASLALLPFSHLPRQALLPWFP